MCGICIICSPFGGQSFAALPGKTEHLTDQLLRNRGPDVSTQHVVNLGEGITGCMQGCVLHLRGQLTPQPVVDADGNALLWNGEIFGGIQVENEENDTQILFKTLTSCTSEDQLLSTMQAVQGPWAFIFFQASQKTLWFGRDIFGRRSLLWHLPDDPHDRVILSSVALGDETFAEIPSVGIFSLNFSNFESKPDRSTPALTLYPWRDCVWPGTTSLVVETPHDKVGEMLFSNQTCCIPVTIDNKGLLTSWIPPMNQYVPEAKLQSQSDIGKEEISDSNHRDQRPLQPDRGCEQLPEVVMESILQADRDLDMLSDELIKVLEEAVRTRVCNIPDVPHQDTKSGASLQTADNTEDQNEEQSKARVAILFSGGLDSSVLAALADRCVPPDEPIDLMNVAFEQPAAKTTPQVKKPPKKTRAERIASRKQKELEKAKALTFDAAQEKLSCAKDRDEAVNLHSMAQSPLLNNQSYSDSCSDKDTDLPVESSVPLLDDKGSENSNATVESRIPLSSHASGESLLHQDNTVRCADLAIECNSPNVPPTTTNDGISLTNSPATPTNSSFNVPDRQTGRLALSELNPHRQWNFIEVNVSQGELQSLRQHRIRRLIYPLHTVLDDSIGCAVWFAARGRGLLATDRGQPICSKARVLLCGMAADEQFAGYSRHRVTFNKFGLQGLTAELEEEIWRISARNLGRDDRIITDHGKESRFPFLDENFTRFVSNIPIHKRADLQLPRGIGEKLLLRIAAMKLGLVKTACQPKRAIQFGSRIAKLDNSKEKGSDVCQRLS